jgi:predicted esterase YcpF (UPF0227 family)
MSALLVYIHGFLSSPLSQKAVEMQGYIRQQALAIDTRVPQLSNYPGQAYDQLQQLLDDAQGQYQHIGLVGSSMGGFYATGLAEQFGLKAVLVNPVVAPAKLMSSYLGEHENPYSGQQFCLTRQHVDELRGMTIEKLSKPERCWLMVQQGDETLDYQAAVDFYVDSPQLIEPNGNHRFENFEKHLPKVMKFLELA